jgi:signal transduction histidine kinase
MSDSHQDNNDAQQYQYDYLRTFLQWAIVIVLFVTLVYGAIYIQRPSLPIAITTLSFTFILPLAWGGLYFLQQRQLHIATWIYLVGTLLPATTFTLFATDRLLLVGLIGYILLIRIAIFLQTPRPAFMYGLFCLALYVATITLRLMFPLPTVQLGEAEVIVLYVLPVLGVVLFSLLDRIGSLYLREALAVSESARQNLVSSYTQLQTQTEALAQSEASLSQLAERLEKSNHELQTVNEEIKSFAYITSHDLRAPLINLKGFASELREAWQIILPITQAALPQLEAEQQQIVHQALVEDGPEALAFIDSAVTRMDGFINSLLRLSRLGQREMVFNCVDMNEVIKATGQSLAHQIAAKNVDLQVAELPEITADYTSMIQIMSNLLTNAVNYLMPDRHGKIEIWAEESSQETLFYVRDNGRGIASRDMHKLFEPFRRIGEHNTPGEGMGLAYVQTLVRRHNGRIWCESQEGSGSTFVFTISKPLNIKNDDE